jgi:hypothetical protein
VNAKLVNSAAGVILAALQQNRTPAGIALALDSARLLMTPEDAAEVERLRLRADEVERAYAFDTAELKRQLESARVDGRRLIRAEQRTAELEAVRATHRKDDHAEIEQLRTQVAALLAERHSTNEALDDAAQALRVHRDRVAELASRLRAGQTWQKGRTPALVSQDLVSQDELRQIFGIPLEAPWADGIARRIVPVQALREAEPAEVKDGCPRNVIDGDVGGHFFKHGAIVDGPMRCVYCGAAKPEAGA